MFRQDDIEVCIELLVSRRFPRPKRSLDEGVAGGSDDSRLIVQYDFDRHFLEQLLHPALVQERLHEDRILHFGHDFCGDTTAEENASRVQEIQSAIPSLGSIDTYKE